MSCKFILIRGQRSGLPCGNNVNGSDYCSRHCNMLFSGRHNEHFSAQEVEIATNHRENERAIREEQRANFFRDIEHINLEEHKEEHKDESCTLCHEKMKGPKVILECKCEYHLKCFMIIQNETKCLKCNDKIHKTNEDYEDCSICLEKIKSGNIKTRCGHIFHEDCINKWKNIGKNTCPNCRGDI